MIRTVGSPTCRAAAMAGAMIAGICVPSAAFADVAPSGPVLGLVTGIGALAIIVLLLVVVGLALLAWLILRRVSRAGAGLTTTATTSSPATTPPASAASSTDASETPPGTR